MRQSILTLLCSIRCLASHHSPLSIVTLSVGLNLRELYICHSFFNRHMASCNHLRIGRGCPKASSRQSFKVSCPQRCSGQVTFQDGSLLPSRRCLLGDRKWPAFHTFFLKTEVWWMDYHKRYGYAMQLAWKSNTEEPCNAITPPKFIEISHTKNGYI